MRLDAVMDEVAKVAKEITGLRVINYPAATVTVDKDGAGYVSYPREIKFDETYGRGDDQFTDLPLVLLAGEPTADTTRDVVARWASGDGPLSVKRVFEQRTTNRAWESCDDAVVTLCEFDVEVIAGIPYLAAIFKITVVGPGGD